MFWGARLAWSATSGLDMKTQRRKDNTNPASNCGGRNAVRLVAYFERFISSMCFDLLMTNDCYAELVTHCTMYPKNLKKGDQVLKEWFTTIMLLFLNMTYYNDILIPVTCAHYSNVPIRLSTVT